MNHDITYRHKTHLELSEQKKKAEEDAMKDYFKPRTDSKKYYEWSARWKSKSARDDSLWKNQTTPVQVSASAMYSSMIEDREAPVAVFDRLFKDSQNRKSARKQREEIHIKERMPSNNSRPLSWKRPRLTSDTNTLEKKENADPIEIYNSEEGEIFLEDHLQLDLVDKADKHKESIWKVEDKGYMKPIKNWKSAKRYEKSPEIKTNKRDAVKRFDQLLSQTLQTQ